jgi:hypothetical protein
MEQHSGRQGTMYWRVAAASMGAAALFLFPPCCFPLNFLAAVPCAQVRARLGPFYGWRVSALAGLAVALATGALYGPAAGAGFGLFFFAVVAAPAVVMTGWAGRGVRTDHAVLIGFVFCLIALAAGFFLFTVTSGVTPAGFVNQMNQEGIDFWQDLFDRSFSEQQQDEMQPLWESFEDGHRLLGRYLYAILGIWFMIGLSAVSAIMAHSKRFGVPERFPTLDYLRVRVPDMAVYPFILCGLLTLFRIDALRTWCYNILLILGFMYFLCGVSILAWYMARLGVPLVFKILFCLLVLSYPPFALLAAGIGLFDQWFDFRKLRSAGPTGPPDAPADSG